MKSGQISLNTVEQVNTAHLKITVNSARLMTNLSKLAHSTVKWPIHKNPTFKNCNFNQRVNTVKDKKINTVRPKAVVNAVKGNDVNAVMASACWIQVSDGLGPQKNPIFLTNVHGNPQIDLQDKGVIDSGCSRHMTWKMSYLTDYKEIDRGYVAFGSNPKGGKIIGRVPRKNNMYSVDLNNIVLKGGLTCHFVKATSDESKLWHRRLGHINFKTMNKLVKGDLVRAERKNRTLIEAARTMLADSKLPTTFWAKVVNSACYVENRLLVTKPHNKTPYEVFLGRKPALGFMKTFRCPVTILNTIYHLDKFDGKADEGFFVGYSINSKSFRLFNSRTRIVEENLHVQRLHSTTIVDC
ncbi:ribonuclease H-like domain-containing protein [Tanacetum coccineum]